MKFNVSVNDKVRSMTEEELEQAVAKVMPEWAVYATVEHMKEAYANADEGSELNLDELSELTSPYQVIDYDEAVYLCQNMIEDEDEDEIIEIIEEWLEGHLDTNHSTYGYEFLIFTR